jgi:hypothetical protein
LNPVSLLELSVHERSISRHPTAVAVRFDGACGGGGVGVGGGGVGGGVVL